MVQGTSHINGCELGLLPINHEERSAGREGTLIDDWNGRCASHCEMQSLASFGEPCGRVGSCYAPRGCDLGRQQLGHRLRERGRLEWFRERELSAGILSHRQIRARGEAAGPARDRENLDGWILGAKVLDEVQAISVRHENVRVPAAPRMRWSSVVICWKSSKTSMFAIRRLPSSYRNTGLLRTGENEACRRTM